MVMMVLVEDEKMMDNPKRSNMHMLTNTAHFYICITHTRNTGGCLRVPCTKADSMAITLSAHHPISQTSVNWYIYLLVPSSDAREYIDTWSSQRKVHKQSFEVWVHDVAFSIVISSEIPRTLSHV